MAEQLSLKQLSQYTFATDERLAKMESGTELDEEPTEFTAFYHRDRGGVEEDVLVRDVNEIIEESKWGPLLDKGFERIAYLLEGRIPSRSEKKGTATSMSSPTVTANQQSGIKYRSSCGRSRGVNRFSSSAPDNTDALNTRY